MGPDTDSLKHSTVTIRLIVEVATCLLFATASALSITLLYPSITWDAALAWRDFGPESLYNMIRLLP
jgi:hypothetical protein